MFLKAKDIGSIRPVYLSARYRFGNGSVQKDMLFRLKSRRPKYQALGF
jgi:hypothetical protein